MVVSDFEQRGKATKVFKLEHIGRRVWVALNYVASDRNVVQVSYVDCDEGRIKRWKPYGSFLELIEKKLECRISRSRQDFIDDLYYNQIVKIS